MAMARLDRPALMIYGGTIKPGRGRKGDPLDIVSAFQSYGEFIAERIDEEGRFDIVRHACPGAGACGGMYTANTMASAIEALGMSLPVQRVDPRRGSREDRRVPARRRGRAPAARDATCTPREIMTRHAFENAIAVVSALGGSTNAVLHLIAMARAASVPLTLDDFQAVSDRVPFLADLKPSGRYVMEDLHARRRHAGGDEAAAREGRAARRLHDGHRQDARRESGGAAGSRRRPGRDPAVGRSDQGDRRTSRSCAARSRRTARSRRSPARKASPSRARRRSSTAKKR